MFSEFEDLTYSQGDLALILDYDEQTGQLHATGYTQLANLDEKTISEAYLFASDDDRIQSEIRSTLLHSAPSNHPPIPSPPIPPTEATPRPAVTDDTPTKDKS